MNQSVLRMQVFVILTNFSWSEYSVTFPTYKKTKYVQNNSHFKNLVILFKSHHTVTKLDTLLGGTGHIYIYNVQFSLNVCPVVKLGFWAYISGKFM